MLNQTAADLISVTLAGAGVERILGGLRSSACAPRRRNWPCRLRSSWSRPGGLSLYMLKAALHGRGDEIIEFARTNLGL